MKGPRCTVEIRDAKAKITPLRGSRADVGLFFPNAHMLNNLFKGKGLTIPLPYKGLFQMKGLMVFSKLAERMQEVLDGKDTTEVELRAELMLGLMSRAVAVLANRDPEYKSQAARLHGVAEFRIRGSYASHVDFSGPQPRHLPAMPLHRISLEFADSPLFLAVTQDKVDVLAKACLGEISLKGDLHMGQIINIALDKIGEYLLKEAGRCPIHLKNPWNCSFVRPVLSPRASTAISPRSSRCLAHTPISCKRPRVPHMGRGRQRIYRLHVRLRPHASGICQ